MLDWIEEGTLGHWTVKHFEISKQAAAIEAISYIGSHVRPPDAGKYTGLYHDKRGVIMSDTRQELIDIGWFKSMLRESSKLKVHINGLGLGIVTKIALDQGFSVDVVEIDEDVITLVGSQLLKLFPDHLNIIHADALLYKPPKENRYSVVWHDIWDDIRTDNFDQYKLLMRRWGRKTEKQGAWVYWLLKEKRKEEKRWEQQFRFRYA